MFLLSRNALFLGARMWESAIEGRCNRSKLTRRAKEKMNATAEAIKRDGTSKKSLRMGQKRKDELFKNTPPLLLLLLSAPLDSSNGERNWRLRQRNRLYLAAVS